VTHGTATLEETAWFLDLTIPAGITVVVTGAQRPANTAGSDVPGNLRGAIAVALDPKSQAAGVTVVMNNTVFSARDVTKTSSFDLAAFEGGEFGPLATIHADAVVHWRRMPAISAPKLCADIQAIKCLPRVDISLSYAGADDTAVQAFLAAGAKAVISAGFLPGRPSNLEFAALKAVAKEVIVVQSTRSLRGYVTPQKFLTDNNMLAGGDLSPQKLRILIMIALACETPRQQLQDLILAH
jgi:L-asparaginase